MVASGVCPCRDIFVPRCGCRSIGGTFNCHPLWCPCGLHQWGYPNSWMVYDVKSENPIKIDDLGVPLFKETFICFFLIFFFASPFELHIHLCIFTTHTWIFTYLHCIHLQIMRCHISYLRKCIYIYIIQIHNKHTYAYKVYLRYTHVLVLAYHIPIDTYTHMYRAEVEKQTGR